MRLPNFIIFIFIVCSGCSSVTTLKNPISGPQLLSHRTANQLKFNIAIEQGGSVGYKFLNPKNVRGNLWFAYSLQVIENGELITLELHDVIHYDNSIIENRKGYPVDIDITHKPVLSNFGTVVLRWKILIAPEIPTWSDNSHGHNIEYGYSDEYATVLSGCEVIGFSSFN